MALHRAVDQALAGLDGRQALVLGRVEVVQRLQLVHRHHLRLLGDADGALALHVGVAAHRQDARAGLADVAAAAAAGWPPSARWPRPSCAASGPCRRRRSRAWRADHRRRRFERRARQAAAFLDRRPLDLRAGARRTPGSRACARAMKAWSRTASSPLSRALVVESRSTALHSPVSAARSPPALTWWYCVFIAVSAGVSICTGDCGLAKRTSPGSFSGLNTRIGHAALAAVLQVVQHARRVGADVVADDEDAVGLLEVLQLHRAHRHADALGQADRRALVAHVGAVGQVVVAVQARHQRVHVRGLQRRAARRVEHRLLRLRAPSAARRCPSKASCHDTSTYLSVAASQRIGAVRRPVDSSVEVGPAFELGERVLARRTPACSDRW